MPQPTAPWDTLHEEDNIQEVLEFDDDAWQTHVGKFSKGALVCPHLCVLFLEIIHYYHDLC